MRFPFFDRTGQIVLWDRRKQFGRRKAEDRTTWGKKDLPGLVLMAVMFIVLSLGVLYLWISKPLLSTQDVIDRQSIYAQSVTDPNIGPRAIKSLLGY